jgi:hypothetical protein
MSSGTELVRREGRAPERSEVERRRVIVARLRWLESQLTALEIVEALRRENPPINVCIRTVERDFIAIRDDTRRYLNARNFDARFEVGAALARHELIARMATNQALTVNAADRSNWARIAIRATEAKTRLLQDINLIDRTIGTLFIDDGPRGDRIPSGAELFQRYRDVIVTQGDVTSDAELHYRHGDEMQSLAAARDARDSGRDDAERDR